MCQTATDHLEIVFVGLQALKRSQSQRHHKLLMLPFLLAENLGGKTYSKLFNYKLHIRIFEFVLQQKPQPISALEFSNLVSN